MERNMHYRTKSLKELLDIYAFEQSRIDEEDAEITQRNVITEAYARIADAFTLLNKGEDVEAAYRQLIEG